MKTLDTLSRGRDLIRQYGLRTSAFRARYLVSKRTGRLKRRFPAHAWEDRPLEHWCRPKVPIDPRRYVDHRRQSEVRFFFAPESLPRLPEDWHAELLGEANAIVDGKVRYFSAQQGPIGSEEHWFRNPLTGQRAERTRHWCDREDVSPEQGDIKFIWEPSRFSWVFAIVRAYAAIGDETYPRTFWRLFESWLAANPPQIGPNWQCGQECSFRLFAMCFAMYGFGRAPASTDRRLAGLAAAIAVHAERIDKNIDFALSQKNNHGISEAAGLYTAGTLFPEFTAASQWRSRGKQLLEREALLQIYPDGSYVQHSMNYHRVMLHDFLWVLGLAAVNEDAFSDQLTERLRAAGAFLHQMQEDATGRLPNYGPNDGALILPLTNCDYLDYRPTLQALRLRLEGKRYYQTGIWDELALWTVGSEALNDPIDEVPRTSTAFPDGGYDTLRGPDNWAMIRCHTYRDRPNEADMLHLDLWWRGENILRDAGTYSYNCPPPWNHHFRSTAAHNTVVVDDLDQMTKGPRFMWFDWIESERLAHRPPADGRPEFWQGQHLGYRNRQGVVHRRTVERFEDHRWIVTDELLGDGTHKAALYWHLPDVPHEWDEEELTLQLSTGVGPVWLFLEAPGPAEVRGDVVRGLTSGEHVLGWESLYYGVKEPHIVLRLVLTGACPMKIVTRIGLGHRPGRSQGITADPDDR